MVAATVVALGLGVHSSIPPASAQDVPVDESPDIADEAERRIGEAVISVNGPVADSTAWLGTDELAELSAKLDDVAGDPPIEVLETNGDWLIPFEAGGVGTHVSLAGQVGETVVQLAVPDGFQPRYLRATMTISPDVDSGYIEYSAEGIETRTINLGSRRDGTRVERPQVVVFDLRGIDVRREKITLTIRNRLRSEDTACTTTLQGAWVDLNAGGWVLRGAPTPPTQVNTFIPPLLTELELHVPAEPTSNEAEAAALVALGVVRNVIGNAPDISIVPLDDPGVLPQVEFSPTRRSIVVSEALSAGLHIVTSKNDQQGSLLALGGDGEQLVREAAAMSGEYRALTAGTIVDVSHYDPDGEAATLASWATARYDEDGLEILPVSSADSDIDVARQTRFTLDELEIFDLGTTGVGRMEMLWFIDQASLGGPVEAARLRGEGRFTPLADSAQATISIFFNGVLAHAENLQGNDAGHFEFDVTLTPELLTRTLGLQVIVDYTPPSGFCRPGEIPFELQVDPFTELIVVPGQIQDPSFDRYPQVFVPEFRVGLDAYSHDRVALAIRTLAALQRITREPLEPDFVDLQTAMATNQPSFLVAEDTADIGQYLDLLADEPLAVASEDRVELLRFDVDVGRAILSAYELENNDRLLLTWTEGEIGVSGPELATDLIDSFSSRTDSFKTLFGDTYLVSEGSPPLSISVRAGEVQPTPIQLAPDYLQRAVPFLIGLLVAVAGVVLFVLMQRRRSVEHPRRFY